MGYYINNDSQGKHIGTTFNQKINALIEDGAERVVGIVKFQPNLVCVVDNGMFGAAGYAYSKEEFEDFNYNYSGDNRRRVWLVYPHAAKLSGYEGD